jgi:hypothetical protein
MTATRIRERDCLYQLFEELGVEGLRLKPWHADERDAWRVKVRDVLAAVECPAQRMAWTYKLAVAFAGHYPGMPLDIIMDWIRQEEA